MILLAKGRYIRRSVLRKPSTGESTRGADSLAGGRPADSLAGGRPADSLAGGRPADSLAGVTAGLGSEDSVQFIPRTFW